MEQILILMPWIWGVIVVTTTLITLFTKDIDAVWFAISATISLVFALFNIPIEFQLSSFVLVTIGLLFTIGRYVKKYIMTKNIPMNSNSLIGKEILILETVNEFEKGSGVINDIVWTVSCQAGTTIEKGKHAIIMAIDENELVVTNKTLNKKRVN